MHNRESGINGDSGSEPIPFFRQPREMSHADDDENIDIDDEEQPFPEDDTDDQQLFYQLNMKDITKALLVPAHMLSSKLHQPYPTASPLPSTLPVTIGAETASTASSAEDAAVDAENVGELPPTAAASAMSSNVRAQRYRPHHSTLKAAVLTSPENTFYVEDTLLIGSVSKGKGNLFADPIPLPSQPATPSTPIPAAISDSRTPNLKSSSIALALGSSKRRSGLSPVARSAPLFAPQKSLLNQQSDAAFSPTMRSGVTFVVRKPSRISFGVDTSKLGNGLDDPLLVENSDKKQKKCKSVRFPENVIKSVSVVEAEDQLHLLVEYNRPWYAYMVLLVAIAFFVIGWSFIFKGTLPSDNIGRLAAATVTSFVAFGFASAYLIVYLALVWRPETDELEYLLDFSRNHTVIRVVASGVVSQLSLVAAIMLNGCSVSLLCFCCCPLVLTYLYEEYKKHSVSVLDAVGCVLVVGSFAVFTVGAEVTDEESWYRRILPVIIAIAGGAAMSFFLFQLRTVSRNVSNLLVMSSTLILTTLLLAFFSYITDGFTHPIGKSKRPLTSISSEDFLNMILGGLFIFFSWFTYHWSSLFFDRMTLSGSFSLGAPFTLLAFYLMSMPVAAMPYAIAGGISMTFGCGLVLYSGYQFRKNVEVQIDLER